MSATLPRRPPAVRVPGDAPADVGWCRPGMQRSEVAWPGGDRRAAAAAAHRRLLDLLSTAEAAGTIWLVRVETDASRLRWLVDAAGPPLAGPVRPGARAGVLGSRARAAVLAVPAFDSRLFDVVEQAGDQPLVVAQVRDGAAAAAVAAALLAGDREAVLDAALGVAWEDPGAQRIVCARAATAPARAGGVPARPGERVARAGAPVTPQAPPAVTGGGPGRPWRRAEMATAVLLGAATLAAGLVTAGSALGQRLTTVPTLGAIVWDDPQVATHPPVDVAAAGPGPARRWGMAVTADPARGDVVLYGGLGDGGRLLGDTWTWNGTVWRATAAPGPSPRAAAALTFDGARGEVVLFGGSAGPLAFDETWTWNGTAWTRRHPTVSPPPRHDAAMTYDSHAGVVVLFGGFTGDGTPLDDTWTWDGLTWTRANPPVAPVIFSGQWAMAYDERQDETVLVGGALRRPAVGTPLPTWTWNGGDWTPVASASFPEPLWTAMAYEPLSGGVLLLTGPAGAPKQTWRWNGDHWARVPARQAPDGSEAAMVDDSSLGLVVALVRSETDPSLQTWTWDGATWTHLASTPAAPAAAAPPASPEAAFGMVSPDHPLQH